MELSDKIVKEICLCGEFRNLKRGPAIFCENGNGKDAPTESIEFMSIRKGQVCLATTFYSTGHVNYDSEINVERMEKCPYKIKKVK